MAAQYRRGGALEEKIAGQNSRLMHRIAVFPGLAVVFDRFLAVFAILT
jgi:hypothetical protein